MEDLLRKKNVFRILNALFTQDYWVLAENLTMVRKAKWPESNKKQVEVKVESTFVPKFLKTCFSGDFMFLVGNTMLRSELLTKWSHEYIVDVYSFLGI